MAQYLSLGDRGAYEAAIDQVEAILAPLPQPHYRWRMPILRANRAVLRGEIVEAERWIQTATWIAREQELDRAKFSSLFASLSLLAVTRSQTYALTLVDAARASRSISGDHLGIVSFTLARAGIRDEARARSCRCRFRRSRSHSSPPRPR